MQPHLPAGTPEIRVAVIDDHALVRDAMADLLEMAGLKVVAVTPDPDELMSRLDATGVDVVLIDLMLEDGTAGRSQLAGKEVLRRVREKHPNARPVILSAVDEPEVVNDCMRQGAAGVLCKHSVSQNDVISAVLGAFRGETITPAHHADSEPGVTGSGDSVLNRLTPREREILLQISAGAGNMAIATALGLSERTVKAHVSSIYRKLNVENRTELALTARKLGVRPIES